MTGLPGSGKSTIARALYKILKECGVHTQIVSSDMLRNVITPSPKYTEDEREIVYNTLLFVTILLTENGVNVSIDATANRRRYRFNARRKMQRFVKAYIRCKPEVCVQRESRRKEETFYAPTDIYKKAFSGRSLTVPGLVFHTKNRWTSK